ncbi:hypothetical protein BWI17_07195 [Betaproteobacteria bacterium GR16-43]|nr:hypothetical protein BWI17_07195 [Betaproteobacteria bacterium GR16-43]
MTRFLLALLAVPLLAGAAPPIPMAATPEEVGLSSAQLERIEATTQGNVKSGVPLGAVMAVARHGKIAWYKAIGERAPGEAMRTDAVFRIYSMTKPIVSVAVMMLFEEGKVQLADPITKYIPELGAMKVGTEGVEPARPMTIQDLLTHTSGLIYPDGSNKSAVSQAYNAAALFSADMTTVELIKRASKLPLRFSPGTQWEYGISTDVLGRLLEVVDGKSLGEVLAARIFKPLGMTETGFFLPASMGNRAAQFPRKPGAPQGGLAFDVTRKPGFESGGGGLAGTTDDYLRFAQMLLNGGEFNGKRILTRKSIELMTTNHVGDMLGRPGYGFGLGFEVRASNGAYGWAGVAGTYFWVSPKEDLIAIYMTQVDPMDRARLRAQFRSMVEAAIQ